MGNYIISTYILPIIVNAGKHARTLYDKTDVTLDYVSVHMCMEKPSHDLAASNLHIPEKDLSLLMQLSAFVRETLRLMIVPIKMLNDKKFAIHVYETSASFMTQNIEQPQNIVTLCEKMLMYITFDQNKIIEPTNKQVIKMINLHGIDHNIPVEYWYTYKIDDIHKVFFFIHVLPLQNYKSIILAVDKNVDATNSFLTKMKQSALDHYDQTLGKNDIKYSTHKRMDFI